MSKEVKKEVEEVVEEIQTNEVTEEKKKIKINGKKIVKTILAVGAVVGTVIGIETVSRKADENAKRLDDIDNDLNGLTNRIGMAEEELLQLSASEELIEESEEFEEI